MHVSAALFVNRNRLICKLLDYFEDFAAALAFVFVNGQLSSSIAEAAAPDAAR
jgi:hypothetical protein